jgi:putative zinc finger/helix-turn-helix YgiT family protein
MTASGTEARKSSRCPVCGRADLEPRTRTERFTYEDGPRLVEVVAENVPVLVCPACGETYSGPAAWSIRDEAIRRALGLLTPAQLRELRAGLRLALAELAAMVGVDEQTLTEWEAGRAIPTRTADRLLRLVAAHPETIPFLAGLPGLPNGAQHLPTPAPAPAEIPG